MAMKVIVDFTTDVGPYRLNLSDAQIEDDLTIDQIKQLCRMKSSKLGSGRLERFTIRVEIY